MRKMAYVTICCVAVSACAPDVWLKEGGSQAEFSQDQGACQMFVLANVEPIQPAYVPPTYTSYTTAQATYMGGGMAVGSSRTTVTPDYSGQAGANLGAAIGNAVRERDAMRACMESKGYTLKTK